MANLLHCGVCDRGHCPLCCGSVPRLVCHSSRLGYGSPPITGLTDICFDIAAATIHPLILTPRTSTMALVVYPPPTYAPLHLPHRALYLAYQP